MGFSVMRGVCADIIRDGEFLEEQRAALDVAGKEPGAVFLRKRVSDPGAEPRVFLREDLCRDFVGEPPRHKLSEDAITHVLRHALGVDGDKRGEVPRGIKGAMSQASACIARSMS